MNVEAHSLACLAAGASVGPYDVLGVLGRGGTSIVYEATHRGLGRRVALKVMHARGAALRDPARAAARFMREGRAAAAVRHPHVVDVFDAGVATDAMYIAMELVEGETLAALLAREGPLAPARVVDLLLPVIAAVAELHGAGVIHRDLKPANILLARGPDGEHLPKVADFGLSRHDDDDGLTESGALLGTLAYMAPEQHRSAAGADARADQFALGVVLYECLTHRLPFDGATLYARMHAVVTRAPRAPGAVCSGVPGALDAVVLRALQRDPADRFPSLDELGAALLPFATADVRERWRQELGGEVAPARSSRHVTWLCLAAGAAALLIGAGVARDRPRTAAVPLTAATLTAIAPPAPTASIALLPLPSSPAPAIAHEATPPPRPRRTPKPPAAAASAAAPLPSPPSRPRESGENDAPIIDPD